MGKRERVRQGGAMLLYIANNVTTCGVTALTDVLMGAKCSIGIIVARGTAGFVGPLMFRALARRGYLVSAFSHGFRCDIRRIALTG